MRQSGRLFKQAAYLPNWGGAKLSFEGAFPLLLLAGYGPIPYHFSGLANRSCSDNSGYIAIFSGYYSIWYGIVIKSYK